MRVGANIGDVFRIPLSEGADAYAQYIHFHLFMGSMVRLFWNAPLVSSALNEAKIGTREIFPPVFVGLKAITKTKRWQLLGNYPTPEFIFPKFRINHATKPGVYDNWWIWDGCTSVNIGALPYELRRLEMRLGWGDEGLENRIIRGIYWGDKVL